MKKRSTSNSSHFTAADVSGQIDEAPEITAGMLQGAILMPPVQSFASVDDYFNFLERKSVSQNSLQVSLSPDVAEWFQQYGGDYSARINAALRLYMLAHQHPPHSQV